LIVKAFAVDTTQLQTLVKDKGYTIEKQSSQQEALLQGKIFC
jgi:hypothetical protein